MRNMDLDFDEERFVEVVTWIRTAEDISAANVSRIVLSTLVDYLGESTAENVLELVSADLANLIFQHDVVDIPDLAQTIPIDRLDSKLFEQIVQDLRAELSIPPDEDSD